MCVDPSGLNSPVEMETDGPFIEDVQMLKKTVQARAIQVIQRAEQSFIIIIIIIRCGRDMAYMEKDDPCHMFRSFSSQSPPERQRLLLWVRKPPFHMGTRSWRITLHCLLLFSEYQSSYVYIRQSNQPHFRNLIMPWMPWSQNNNYHLRFRAKLRGEMTLRWFYMTIVTVQKRWKSAHEATMKSPYLWDWTT